MPEIAARTRIDRADDERPRRKPGARSGTGDAHFAVLERLAERLERRAAKFGKLVEKEHAVVRETHLAGAGHVAAADEARLAH
jgi:hypothetical protein